MEILRDRLKSASKIMAIGVGGGGGNAVNHIYISGKKDISFLLLNTDRQALKNSPLSDSHKIQMGDLGLGAGNDPEKGRQLALEAKDEIEKVLRDSKIRMVFIVAGLGAGTGTGASPVVAEIAKSLGILTIAVVTIPFGPEGRTRIENAITGLERLNGVVDSLLIINNSNLVELYGDLSLSKANYISNELISKAVLSIATIVSKYFIVNVDFVDVRRVMTNSGVAFMGTGVASGTDRSLQATRQALTSPLLHMQDITGAKNVLVCMTSSSDPQYEIRMSDTQKVPSYIQQQTKMSNLTNIIWGAGYDDSLGDKMQVVVIVTGFSLQNMPSMREYYADSLQKSITIKHVVPEPEIQKVKPAAGKVSKVIRLYHEFDDAKPAYLRRNIQLGQSTDATSRRHKEYLNMDDDLQVKQTTLFDF